MNMIPRSFQYERDLDAMRELLVSGRRAANGTYYVHMGDLNWWLFYPPLSGDFWGNIYLWDDPEREGELLGWSLLSLPETFDVYVRPDLRGTELADQMYTWAVEATTKTAREAGEENISIQWVLANDHVLDGWLAGLGMGGEDKTGLFAAGSRQGFRLFKTPGTGGACPHPRNQEIGTIHRAI